MQAGHERYANIFPLFLCHSKNIVYLCRVFMLKLRLCALLMKDGDTT